MSVPCVGHLEAQRGGYCTVSPISSAIFWSLPVTTKIELWKTQAASAMEKRLCAGICEEGGGSPAWVAQESRNVGRFFGFQSHCRTGRVTLTPFI
jgi:hypothetical protein